VEQIALLFVLDASRLREDRVMKKIASTALACLALGACSTPVQTVGRIDHEP
jgi:hypothetical protein